MFWQGSALFRQISAGERVERAMSHGGPLGARLSGDVGRERANTMFRLVSARRRQFVGAGMVAI
jgi:hypothetical protein